jgi:hypothetical protein
MGQGKRRRVKKAEKNVLESEALLYAGSEKFEVFLSFD